MGAEVKVCVGAAVAAITDSGTGDVSVGVGVGVDIGPPVGIVGVELGV